MSEDDAEELMGPLLVAGVQRFAYSTAGGLVAKLDDNLRRQMKKLSQTANQKADSV
jgi:hypothetical protein